MSLKLNIYKGLRKKVCDMPHKVCDMTHFFEVIQASQALKTYPKFKQTNTAEPNPSFKWIMSR